MYLQSTYQQHQLRPGRGLWSLWSECVGWSLFLFTSSQPPRVSIKQECCWHNLWWLFKEALITSYIRVKSSPAYRYSCSGHLHPLPASTEHSAAVRTRHRAGRPKKLSSVTRVHCWRKGWPGTTMETVTRTFFSPSTQSYYCAYLHIELNIIVPTKCFKICLLVFTYGKRKIHYFSEHLEGRRLPRITQTGSNKEHCCAAAVTGHRK